MGLHAFVSSGSVAWRKIPEPGAKPRRLADWEHDIVVRIDPPKTDVNYRHRSDGPQHFMPVKQWETSASDLPFLMPRKPSSTASAAGPITGTFSISLQPKLPQPAAAGGPKSVQDKRECRSIIRSGSTESFRILLLFCKDEPTAVAATVALNKAGADGWELVSVTENQRGVHTAFSNVCAEE
jgi:hypothetical protein